ncbi:hypothetical protein PV326_000996 [Microctonus aethiopoides]|nr:hypothetical protein PV326_000996 [Microctonus aethiopoides]
MWRLKKSTVVTIAVFGVLLTVVSPETDIGHRNEGNVESTTTTTTTTTAITSVRCVGKLEIEAMPYEPEKKNTVAMDDTEFKTFSICKWKRREKLVANINSKQQFSSKPKFVFPSINLLKKIVNDSARIRHKRSLEIKSINATFDNVTMSTIEVDTTKPIAGEITDIITSDTLVVVGNSDIDGDISDVIANKTKLLLYKHQNQLINIDKLEIKQNYRILPSTSDSILQSWSSRDGLSSDINVTISTLNSSETINYAMDSVKGALEIPPPLIVSSSSSSSNSSSRSLNTLHLSKEKLVNNDSSKQQPYLKKTPSKSSINLIDGKANKIFYEIKPSLNTAMDDQDDDDINIYRTSAPISGTTKRNLFAGFKMPSSFGKYGPYFLDETDRRNVTERIGSTVMLDCRIGLLGDKKVTWLQHDKESIRLLTVGKVQYSADERISLKFQYPDNWRLQIAYATLRDTGLYKCQVEIDPTHSLVKRYNVIITEEKQLPEE